MEALSQKGRPAGKICSKNTGTRVVTIQPRRLLNHVFGIRDTVPEMRLTFTFSNYLSRLQLNPYSVGVCPDDRASIPIRGKRFCMSIYSTVSRPALGPT
jgi:hypothetical protein